MPFPTAEVQASDEEWNRICEVCYDRGMFVEISEAEIPIAPDGTPVLAGAFGVRKPRRLGPLRCR